MKLLLENWRKYQLLTEAEDIYALYESQVITEAEFIDRIKKWAKRKGIPLAVAISIATGAAAAPSMAHARVPVPKDDITDVSLSNISAKDMFLLTKLVTNPKLQRLTAGMLQDINLHGDTAAASAKAEEIIKIIGGKEKAKDMFAQLAQSEGVFVPLITKYAKKGFDETLKNQTESNLGLSTRPSPELAREMAVDSALSGYDHTLNGFRELIDHHFGSETGDQAASIIYKVTDNLGMGSTAEEFAQFTKDAADDSAAAYDKAQEDLYNRIQKAFPNGDPGHGPEYDKIADIYLK
jgi:hypothetical protein